MLIGGGRWVLAALLAGHGIAHVPGFAVAWRLLTTPELPYHTTLWRGRIDIGDAGMRLVGLGWLLLAIAFVVTAACLALRWRWASLTVIVVAFLSLALCVVEWPFTRVGVVVNIALLALVPAVARTSWGDATTALVAEMRRHPGSGSTGSAIGAMSRLPPVVARYLRRSLAAAPRRAVGAVYAQEAEFMINGQWRPLTATQFVRADGPGFVWDARITMAPFVSAFVRDSYVAGHGAMQADLAAVVPMVAQHGRSELDAGALHRYLAELVWMPSALMPGLAVHWTGIDDHSARVTLVDGTTTVSLDFRFDDEGDVVEIFTAERFAEHDGTYRRQPWRVRCGGHRAFEGVRVPSRCEVAWMTPEGPAPYWRGSIVSAHYTFRSSETAGVRALWSSLVAR